MATPSIRQVVAIAASGSSAVCNLGAGTTVGDLLVVFDDNDFNTAANLPSPTFSQTVNNLTLQATGDGGTNNAHAKVFTAAVTVAGAQTVTCAPSVSGEEVYAHVFVLDGSTVNLADFLDGTPAGQSNASSLSHVAPSVSPATSDALLLCNVAGTTNGAGSAYTPPSGMTEQSDIKDGTFSGASSASQVLSASGATGTKTFTATGSASISAGVSIAIKGSAAVEGRPPFNIGMLPWQSAAPWEAASAPLAMWGNLLPQDLGVVAPVVVPWSPAWLTPQLGWRRAQGRPRRGAFQPVVPLPVVATAPATVPQFIDPARRGPRPNPRRGSFQTLVPAPVVVTAPASIPQFVDPTRRVASVVRRRGQFFTAVAGAAGVPGWLSARPRRAPARRRGLFLTVTSVSTPVVPLLRAARRPAPVRRRPGQLFPLPPAPIVNTAGPGPWVQPPLVTRRKPAQQRRGFLFVFPLVGLAPVPPPPVPPAIISQPHVRRPLSRRGHVLPFVPTPVTVVATWVPGVVAPARRPQPAVKRRGAFARVVATVSVVPRPVRPRRGALATPRRRSRIFDWWPQGFIAPPPPSVWIPGLLTRRRTPPGARAGTLLAPPPGPTLVLTSAPPPPHVTLTRPRPVVSETRPPATTVSRARPANTRSTSTPATTESRPRPIAT